MKILFIIFTITLVSHSAFSQNAKEYIKKGNDLYNQKKYSDAEVEYYKAKSADPKLDIPNYNLGNTYYKQDNYGKAADVYSKLSNSTSDKNTLSRAFHNLGNTHLQNKEYEKAIEAYKKSLINNPSDYDSKYNLEYARKMLQVQQQQQNQNQKDKNQDKNQDKNKQNQQNQQDKNQDKKDKDKQDHSQNQQNKDNKQEQKQNQSQPKISKEDAERILNALKNEEKKLQKDLKKKQVIKSNTVIEKNW